MSRLLTAQPSFKLLVANLRGSGDPSRGINPTKVRTGFEQQVFPEVARGGTPSRVQDARTPGVHTHTGLQQWTSGTTPVGATGTVTVDSNTFSVPATLYLGEYVLVSGEDYTVGGGVNATATNIAAAIDALPDYTAAAVGATVTITGPAGPGGNDVRFEAIYAGTVKNFTLSPTSGWLSGAEPIIGPPDILP